MGFNVVKLDETLTPALTGDQVKLVKTFAKETPNVFQVVAQSIAPSIYGHTLVKEALLCQVISYILSLKNLICPALGFNLFDSCWEERR